jgi:hypothetical protein
MITEYVDNTIAKRTKMLFVENLKPQPTRQHDSGEPWFDTAWAGFGRQSMQPLASTRCSHKIKVSLPSQISTVLQKVRAHVVFDGFRKFLLLADNPRLKANVLTRRTLDVEGTNGLRQLAS